MCLDRYEDKVSGWHWGHTTARIILVSCKKKSEGKGDCIQIALL